MKSWHNYSLKYHIEKEKNRKLNKEETAFESLNNSCASDIAEAKYQKMTNEKRFMRRGGLREGKITLFGKNFEFKVMPNIQAHYADHYAEAKKKKTKTSLTK
jgi:hypothetical protein